MPDEFIFKEDETEFQDKQLYFIQEGNVNIVIQKTKQVIARLEKNDYFGEIGFFTNLDRTASVRSINFTDLFYFDRNDFMTLLSKYPID
jgi:hyperpolarization activated cyclic nucleotide-gated potassium channel 2